MRRESLSRVQARGRCVRLCDVKEPKGEGETKDGKFLNKKEDGPSGE